MFTQPISLFSLILLGYHTSRCVHLPREGPGSVATSFISGPRVLQGEPHVPTRQEVIDYARIWFSEKFEVRLERAGGALPAGGTVSGPA